MKNKKTFIIASSCIASGLVVAPLVSCACVFALRNEGRPVLDAKYLIVDENGVLKGIKWDEISIERIRIEEFETLEIPEGVTEIAPYAFAYMFDGLATHIKTVDFSKATTTLTKIGDGAFNYCYGLESDLDFSEFTNLTEIGSEAFFYCTKLKNLKLPSQIVIGDYAFFQNEALTELKVSPNWIVGSHAFDACSKLSTIDFSDCITIPDWLWEGSWIFNQTGSEATDPKVLVNLDENDIDEWESALNTRQQLPISWKIEAINNESTNKDSFVYDEKDGTVIVGLTEETKTNLNNIKTISIPEGTTKIADEAFAGIISSRNTKVFKNLSLNKELVEIGDNAFESCDMLSGALKLPTKMSALGKQAFKNCFNLTGDIVIPNDVTELKDQVFAYSGIHSVKFHKDIETVGKQLFIGCTKLSVLDLSCYNYGENPDWKKPEDLVDKAFYNPDWTNGTVIVNNYAQRDFMIDQIVALLKDHGMDGHINDHSTWETDKWKCFIADERFLKALPQDSVFKAFVVYQGSVKRISNSFLEDKKYCDYGIVATPDEANSIGEAAFLNVFNNDKKVYWRINLNTGLTKIETNAFKSCTNLIGSLIIPSSVTQIATGAFSGCNHLSGSLILPKNVKSISRYAFQNTNFHTIVLPSTKVCTDIGESALEVTANTKNIDFTRFDGEPSNWHTSFISFGSGSKGTIWAANETQQKAIKTYLLKTSWSSVQSNWPIKVIGKDA